MAKKDAEELLKNIPYNTPEWKKQRKTVMRAVENKYPGQYILCVPGRLEGKNYPIHEKEIAVWDTHTDHSVFSQSQNLFGDDLYFVKRADAEYNFKHKQINVFAYISDSEGNVLLIKKKKNGNEINIPGGHVDFKLNAYRYTPEQILRWAVIQELEEEIDCKDFDYAMMVPEVPSLVFNTNNDWNDLFHIGVVYHIHLVKSLKEFKIKSGETDKHDVLIMSSEEILNNRKQVHPWVAEFTKRYNNQ